MFVGREQELALLREPNWRDQAQLIVVYGRRRVGKTALVEEAYQDSTLWKFDGLEGVGGHGQLGHFADQLGEYEPSIRSGAGPKLQSWAEALDLLVKIIRGRKDQQIVLFFDEFQWMAAMRAPLVALFKSYWDNHFSKNPGLRVVLCGSVSSFMVKKVIRSKALYGRVSTEINLLPLSLKDTRLFFGERRTDQEILEIAICLGTIPQYLKELNPRLSLVQNLNEYAFRPNGFFFGEFQRLFISHFGRNRTYERILGLLSTGPRSAQDLAKACRTSTGGTFTNQLSDLALAGFIEKFVPLDKGPRSRHVRYRILDDYLHFYFRFIRDRRQEVYTGRLDPARFFPSPRYGQWRGHAFERLCRRHSHGIADALRFSGIEYRAGSLFEPGRRGHGGYQIDLLFKRADRVLTICELKYVDRLEAGPLIDRFERMCSYAGRRFPRHGIQRVLISGKEIPVPQRVSRHFDRVLFATDTLFC